MDRLPGELLAHIVSFLPFHEAGNLLVLNRAFTTALAKYRDKLQKPYSYTVSLCPTREEGELLFHIDLTVVIVNELEQSYKKRKIKSAMICRERTVEISRDLTLAFVEFSKKKDTVISQYSRFVSVPVDSLTEGAVLAINWINQRTIIDQVKIKAKDAAYVNEEVVEIMKKLRETALKEMKGPLKLNVSGSLTLNHTAIVNLFPRTYWIILADLYPADVLVTIRVDCLEVDQAKGGRRRGRYEDLPMLTFDLIKLWKDGLEIKRLTFLTSPRVDIRLIKESIWIKDAIESNEVASEYMAKFKRRQDSTILLLSVSNYCLALYDLDFHMDYDFAQTIRNSIWWYQQE